jgi:hypothetical protein
MAARDSANVMEMGAGRRLALAAALALVVWGCVLWAV